MRSARACLLLVTTLAACAGLGMQRKEPGRIALRNVSGADLRSLTVREVPEGERASPVRLGAVAPARNGQTYDFPRRADAPKLPARAVLLWEDESGSAHSAVVQIDDVLEEATGAPGEILAFELRPGGRAVARLEGR